MSRLARLFRPRRSLASAIVAVTLLALPSLARADDGTWQEVGPIVARTYTTVLVDPLRDRLLVVGGQGATSASVDVWSMNLTGTPVWTKLVTGSGPAQRFGHNAIYDAAGDRIILFGGSAGVRMNDVWALNLGGPGTWTALLPTGGPPAPRALASAIYDPVRQRMLVFGGSLESSGKPPHDVPTNDLWALSLDGAPAWTLLAPGGSPAAYPRAGHSAVYDSVGDRLVVYGGMTGDYEDGDTWTLTLHGPLEWQQVPASFAPPARGYHSAIYDPAGNRMIIFGGYRFPTFLNDVWALTLDETPTWAPIHASGTAPNARFGHFAVHDAARGRMVLFGGQGNADVPALSLTDSPTWSSIGPVNSTFHPTRSHHSAIYDPIRHRVITFGGQDAFGQPTNEVWEFGQDGLGAWSKLTPVGPSPAGRKGHSAIYDPVRDRMLVFGGHVGSPIGLTNDLWSLSLSGETVWSPVTAAGTPPGVREWHSAIYDPVRDRMLVFGGDSSLPGGSGGSRDLWELSLSGPVTWTELTTAGPPPQFRHGHTALYDPVSDRMIVFGGYGGGMLNDTWALTLSGIPTWSRISPGGALPSPRAYQAEIYDAARGRIVVHGGENASLSPLADAWAIDVNAPSPLWRQLSVTGPGPSARWGHVAIADPVDDRMILQGGSGNSDTWSLEWPQVTGAPAQTVSIALRLGASAPNPARGTLAIPFTLPAAATARLTILDLQGRVIRTLVHASLPAGSHVAHWDGKTAAGARARSGVYLYRLDALGAYRSGRLVIME